jgi:hypothetical protein
VAETTYENWTRRTLFTLTPPPNILMPPPAGVPPKPAAEDQADEIATPDTTEILARLESAGVPLDDPIVVMALPVDDFTDFAFWSDDADFVREAEDILCGRRGYVEVIRDGIWNRIAAWWKRFETVGKERSVSGARIGVAELHIPHVRGCLGKFATAQTGTLDVSIKVLGFGGGRSKRLTLGSVLTIRECRLLTTGAEYEITVMRRPDDGKVLALCKILSLDGTIIDEELPPNEPHYCRDDYQSAKRMLQAIVEAAGLESPGDYSDLPLHDSRAEKPTTKLSLQTGTVYSAKLSTPATSINGLNIPKVGLEVKSTVTRTIDMSWQLVAGHDYLRFRAERHDMRMFWAWR